MGFWFLILAILPGFSEARGPLPSCKEIWKQGEHRYSFQEPYASFHSRLQRDRCEKEWTILVYMVADNDLEPYALWDLYEMEAAFQASNDAGSTLKTDLLVEVDATGAADARRLHIFSRPDNVYRARTKEEFSRASLEQVLSPVAERIDERRNRSEKARLEDFLLWGARRYPSKNYMVVVWGHGQGWKAYPVKNAASSRYLRSDSLPLAFPQPGVDGNFGGIAFRQSTGDSLGIPDLRDALGAFRRAAGKPVDVYASDSCLMQMTEVAQELAGEARFLVGSTQVQSFLGLPYRRILQELNRGSFDGLRSLLRPSVDGSDEPFLLAKMIPSLMKKSLDPRRGLQGRAEKEAHRFLTASSLSSAELQRWLIPALAKLAASLKSYLQEEPMRSLDLQFVMQNAPQLEGGAQDLGIFLGYLNLLLLEERQKSGILSPKASQLKEAVSRAQRALELTALSYAYGEAYGIPEGTRTVGFVPRAVSLWLPVDPKEYESRRSEFLASRFYRETQWQQWLDLVYRP